MIPRERCAYSAIVDRPPLKLPNAARIIVWTIVNLKSMVDFAPDGPASAAGPDR